VKIIWFKNAPAAALNMAATATFVVCFHFLVASQHKLLLEYKRKSFFQFNEAFAT